MQCFQNALIRHARNGLLNQDHSVSGVCVYAGIGKILQCTRTTRSAVGED